MFGRRTKSDDDRSGAEMFAGLRNQILTLDPVQAGLKPDDPTTGVWGFLMETGYPGGATASVVCLRDGTTSLYTSSGFGIIGAGEHEAVRQANTLLFGELDQRLGDFTASEDTTLPREGETVLRALTIDGQKHRKAREEEFGEGRDSCSGVFLAAHGVLAELRIIDEENQ
jgi:hypothetical protein